MKLFLASLFFSSFGASSVFGATSDCGESITANYMGFEKRMHDHETPTKCKNSEV